MKIRELFVVFVILLIIGTLFSAFLVKSIESDTGAVHVWNLKVWVVDNTLDMMSENISYLWQVRSAFENSGRVYVAYYTPVSIVSNTGFIYNAEDSKKDDKKDGDKKEEKPDPIKKLQDEEKKKEKKSDEKFEEYMKKKEAELEKSFDEVPDIKDEIGEETITAVKSHDRTKIHVAYNNLIYLQSKYEKAGSTDKVQQISRIKDVMDELDRTFTSGKHM